MAEQQTIKLINLHINTENYRFKTTETQEEAINKMIEDQDDKLFNLAEHIINNGLNPNDKTQACLSSHDKTKYNVLEGNRRIVALKLLNNPELINNKYQLLKKKFKKLHDDNKSKIIEDIECTVYDNPSEADKWIKLKHAGEGEGIGTVKWDAQQIQRFDEKVEGKSSIPLQVINILNDSTDVSEEIKSNLPKLPISSLDRLLADPDVRNMLGIEINQDSVQSNVEKKEVIKGLTQVAKDLLDSEFNVRRIYTKEDRQDYIEKFPASSKPNITNKTTKSWSFNAPLLPSATRKTKPNPVDRKVLIPKTCYLKINNPKVNAIYHELQKLNIEKFTNAAAVSFRVFIELTLDCYIESNKLKTATKDSKLIVKITEVCNDLEIKKLADKHVCKGIKSSANNKNDLLGIETWHAYVHNAQFSPTAPNLRITWDNIQSFAKKVWENIE